MTDNIPQLYDETLVDLVNEAAAHNIESDEFYAAAKNLRTFLEIRPLALDAEPKPDPTPVSLTKWQKAKAGIASAWDNETTRVFIKAGGAFAGVGLVVWSTVHKDHVLEKQSMSQANQRNS